MGRINNVFSHYFQNPERFADLFNGICFRGEKAIRAEELTPSSEVYYQPEAQKSGTEEKGKRVERVRDVKMALRTGGALRILALENQDKTDYAMPFRCMQYDTMEYSRQLEELRRKNKEENAFETASERLCMLKKADRIFPVYTLCLYHGEEIWDGPRTLKDMMEFGCDEDGMSRFFKDYPLFLYCINEENDFQVFHQEIRSLFRILRYRKDKNRLKQMMENNPEYCHISADTLEVLSVMMNAPKLWDKRRMYQNMNVETEEEYDMCQALKEWLEEERVMGREEGREEGAFSKTIQIAENMLRKGMADTDVLALTECGEAVIEEIRMRWAAKTVQ
jgi:hypothetical protein